MPPSLLEILQLTTRYFEKAGLENPRLDAEWLIAGVLGCKRLDLFLRFDQPMDTSVLDKIRPLVRRRAKREPLQHILGNVDFAGLRLKVDSRALIPRPETEHLIELLRDRAKENPRRVLDLGTGTGAIALALASRWPDAALVAVDDSEDALTLAQENAALNHINHVHWRKGNWFEGLDEAPFDLIVSNPPYLTEAEWESSQPEVREFDPKSALVAAQAGRADLLTILNGAAAYLNRGGWLALETGIDQHQELATRARHQGYTQVESVPDHTGRDRFFFCQKGY